MPLAAGTIGASAYWYLTRGTGAVSLVLLTLSVTFGVANVRRVRTATLPRFVFDAVHRSVSLTAVVFVGVHVVTAVLDAFAPIQLVDAFIPFVSAYRPLWLGFGAVAFDLLLALVATSLLRRRLGHRAWRGTHWLAYASWPLAVLHGLGTGSDTKVRWMLALSGACVLLVVVAVGVRAAAGWPDRIRVRVPALAMAGILPLGLLIWLPNGPLAANWARRAGTPAALLAASRTGTAAGAGASAGSGGASQGSFTASVTGTVRNGESATGLAVIDMSLHVTGEPLSSLRIRLAGQPMSSGGVEMTSSRVTLGPEANPDQYSGRITTLEGTTIRALVSERGAQHLSLSAQLHIDSGSGSVTGTLTSAAR
jgi:sulfoxide reductase heme-binding subunit YedZ